MQCWGERSGKISENIRLWGLRGGKGLPAGNKLVFSPRETADGVWIPVFEPSPGPRRKNTGSYCMGGRFHFNQGLRKLWAESGPTRFWVRTVGYILGSVSHVSSPVKGHLM